MQWADAGVANVLSDRKGFGECAVHMVNGDNGNKVPLRICAKLQYTFPSIFRMNSRLLQFLHEQRAASEITEWLQTCRHIRLFAEPRNAVSSSSAPQRVNPLFVDAIKRNGLDTIEALMEYGATVLQYDRLLAIKEGSGKTAQYLVGSVPLRSTWTNSLYSVIFEKGSCALLEDLLARIPEKKKQALATYTVRINRTPLASCLLSRAAKNDMTPVFGNVDFVRTCYYGSYRLMRSLAASAADLTAGKGLGPVSRNGAAKRRNHRFPPEPRV